MKFIYHNAFFLQFRRFRFTMKALTHGARKLQHRGMVGCMKRRQASCSKILFDFLRNFRRFAVALRANIWIIPFREGISLSSFLLYKYCTTNLKLARSLLHHLITQASPVSGLSKMLLSDLPSAIAFVAPLPLSSASPQSLPSSIGSPDPRRYARHRPFNPRRAPPQSINLSASNTPKPLPKDAVPYFAYFSNMNPNKVGPHSKLSSRRCNIHRSQKACLPQHELVFDIPGPPPEPAFANLVQTSSSSVQGIVHWLSPKDFDRIARSEGAFSNLLPPLSSLARVKDVDVVVTNYDGTSTIMGAKTVVFNSPVPGFLRSRMRPSRRYVQVAVDGAEYWGIDKEYVARLKAIPTERGPLGGFGLFVEPRPHLLDRPNLYERFGKPSSEIYSPFSPIRATTAVQTLERDGECTDGTELRLLRVSRTPKESTSTRKPLYYIPGIDGTGKGILSQVDALDEEGIYDVSTFIYPFANRQSLKQLADDIIRLIKDDAGDRPVTIIGESMGGVVSLLLAMENEQRLRESSSLLHLAIDNLMLINPATSFKRASPSAIWAFLLGLGFSDEMYARLLPPVLLPFLVDFEAMRNRFGPDIFPRLRKMLFSLTELSHVLPQDALTWRLKLLSEFSVGKRELEALNSEFGPARIGLISSVNDKLLPSLSESYRLRRYFPDLYTMVLPFGGHVPSFDSRFSLAAFLKAFSDAPEQKADKSTLTVPSPSVLKRRAAFRRRFANQMENGSEEKTRQELGRLRGFLEKSTKESSPVFVGEENIPEYDPNRPVLFVCNHTLLGWLDAMYPVERILKERNILVRSLAHPKLFQQVKQNPIAFPNTTRVNPTDMDEFGIIEISPRQLLLQLAGGKWTLLFPGGAKEALKENESQKYCLKWPEDPEFIRACALFGAQVVPISTVGAEDMVRIIASPKQVQRVLDVGSRMVGRPIDWNTLSFEGVPWRDQMKGQENFVLIPPLMIPNGGDRLYFRFGKPIDIDEACLHDTKLEKQLYKKVRDSVSDGIKILLRRRELDDYRTAEKRREFREKYGEHVDPPCGTAWLWSKNGSFLDEDKQPPL